MQEEYYEDFENEEEDDDKAIEEFLSSLNDGRSHEEQILLLKAMFDNIEWQAQMSILSVFKQYVRDLTHVIDDNYEDKSEYLQEELEDLRERTKRFN